MSDYIDPDTEKIRKICESIIGSKIHINFTITLKNGEKYTGCLDNCNIIGDSMENILFPIINKHITTFEKGPKQSSPDFYNRNKCWEWELKCFSNNPGFDISNFNSYISQLTSNLEKKLYKTQYLIFKYNLKSSVVEILDFKLCNIWELLSYNKTYPISLQCKKGMWYNIRPCNYNDINNKNKTPDIFIKYICKAISLTPNKLEDREKIIDNIYIQFYKLQYSQIIKAINK